MMALKSQGEIFSNKTFNEMFERLNSLNEYFPWQFKRAQKEHLDLFGEKIQIGETYFRQHFTGSYSDDIKLSEQSMERVLYVLFAANPNLVLQADLVKEEHVEKTRKAIDKVINRRS